jgi:hypothetical protein
MSGAVKLPRVTGKIKVFANPVSAASKPIMAIQKK